MALTLQQVSEHNSAASCWVIINDKYAGKDASLAFEPIHPPDSLAKNLPPSKHLGSLDATASQQMQTARDNRVKTKDELRVEQAMKERPPLNRLLSIADIENVAHKTLSYKALAYYSSAADDGIANEENMRAFSRFFFNARVMRPVLDCDPSTTILGYRSSIPVFVCGAALAKLGHPLGEANITRGSSSGSIIQMVSSNASLSYEEIAAAASPQQTLFFQLYKSNNDKIAEKRVQEIVKLGYKAIFLTVDAIVAGKREVDIKSPWALEAIENGRPEYHVESGTYEIVNETGTAGALVGSDDQNMTWEKTIPWLRRITDLPIVIKGVQLWRLAEAGCDGILLSNHGGRQLEYSMPPLEVLYRIRQQRPDVFDKLEVYIDGGVRRGTDVVKALCLGAKAVGMGRPFLYAQSAYGEAGVSKAIDILQNEIVKP
ncbi:FMN-dependent dehydrogenase-domain-containing protein [Mucidula mucida]|nr:FMN-dependent dehydrogenase-domain-containing protein [Mucidula mucida]